MTTYAYPNFQSKKALKEAVAAGQTVSFEDQSFVAESHKDYSTFTGTAAVCGPHYPAPHRWYAEIEFSNGKVVKVK